MKLEQLRIPLKPRSSCDCLDLGLKFYGTHLWDMIRLWFWVASPTMLSIYVMTIYLDTHLGHAMSIVFVVCGPWSVLLVQKAIDVSFGGEFQTYPATRQQLQSMVWLMLKAIGVRLMTALGLILLIVPGYLIAVRCSFFVEKQGLSQLRQNSQDRATAKLIKQEFSALIHRSLMILGMIVLYGVSLFLTFDFLVESLFRVSIFWGRMWSEDLLAYDMQYGFLEESLMFMVADPIVVTLLSGFLLLVYPIGRLAWYFSYIDMRVRGDFWDLELRFRKEVERLMETHV